MLLIMVYNELCIVVVVVCLHLLFVWNINYLLLLYTANDSSVVVAAAPDLSNATCLVTLPRKFQKPQTLPTHHSKHYDNVIFSFDGLKNIVELFKVKNENE